MIDQIGDLRLTRLELSGRGKQCVDTYLQIGLSMLKRCIHNFMLTKEDIEHVRLHLMTLRLVYALLIECPSSPLWAYPLAQYETISDQAANAGIYNRR